MSFVLFFAAETRLECLKESVLEQLRALPQNTFASVIAFDSSVRIFCASSGEARLIERRDQASKTLFNLANTLISISHCF